MSSSTAAAAANAQKAAGGRRSAEPGAWKWRLAGIATVLVLWQIAAEIIGSNAVLPGPIRVADNFISNFTGSPALTYLGLEMSSYAGNLGYTGALVLSGWMIGGMLGLLIGTAAARFQWTRHVSEPVVAVFGVVPVLVAAPFFLVWFGFGPLGQFLLVAFFCMVMVCVVSQASVLNLPPRYEEYAAMLGAGRWSRMRRVTIPATLSANLSGFRTALGQAWGLQAVAELLGSPAGVGRAIALRAGTGDIASVLALLIALGCVALAADLVLSAAVRKVTAWQS